MCYKGCTKSVYDISSLLDILTVSGFIAKGSCLGTTTFRPVECRGLNGVQGVPKCSAQVTATSSGINNSTKTEYLELYSMGVHGRRAFVHVAQYSLSI